MTEVIEPLLTIEEVQKIFGGVARRTILRMIDSGDLVKVKVRKRVLIEPESVREYIRRNSS